MWRRHQPQCGADGGEGLCFQPAHVYERQRLCHREDPTSGLQAEWVHHHCTWKLNQSSTWKLDVHSVSSVPLQLIFGWSTKLWRNLEATIPWVVLASFVCVAWIAKQASKEKRKRKRKKKQFFGQVSEWKNPAGQKVLRLGGFLPRENFRCKNINQC